MFQTERIRFRAVQETDFETFHAWWSDPELMVHQTGHAVTLRQRETNDAMFRAWCKDAPSAVAFSVERRSDGVLIGECNLWGYTPKDRCGTLAIMLGRTYWDEGYGTEALRLLLAYSFGELNVHRVQLTVNADNARAIRAYEKAGFVAEGCSREAYFRDGRWCDVVHMGVLQREFWGRPQDAP